MPTIYADRVQETAATPGSGDVTLAGAVSGFQSFLTGIGVGNKCHYFITNATQWECGVGTLSTATNLKRTTVQSSSAGNSLVTFAAGTVTVVADVAADFMKTYNHAVDVVLTAGEALSARDYVYASNATGKAVRPAAGVSFAGIMCGFATEAAALNASVTVRIVGVVPGFSGLTTGRTQFLSTTAGLITENLTGGTLIPIGAATSASEVFVGLQSYKNQSQYMVGIKGYTGGGKSGTVSTGNMYGVTFSTDTTALLGSASLGTVRRNINVLSNGTTTAYFSGGSDVVGSNVVYVNTDIISFSTDVSATAASSNLLFVNYGGCTLSDCLTKGYVLGGETSSATTLGVMESYRLNYSSGTWAAQISAYLGGGLASAATVTDGSTKGYVCGGILGTGSGQTGTYKLVYATDIIMAQPSANLSAGKYSAGSISDGYFKGYISGGIDGAGVKQATTEKLVFVTDTCSAQASASLPVATHIFASCSEGSTKGYYLGGSDNTGTVVLTASKANFATDAVASQASANLSIAFSNIKGVGDVGY